MTQSYTVSIGFLLAIVLTACNRPEPVQGQVLATVDGEEITRAELELEARERSLPIGEDRAIRDALLDELIQRKLLVQEAQRQKLHRTPEHLLAERRLGEIALAQQLLAGADAETASADAVAGFIAANPRAFASRAMFMVDRIAVAAPPSAELQRLLLAAPTVEAMKKLLENSRLKGERKTESWDSAALTPAVYAALEGVGAGQPFAVRTEGGAIVGKMLSISPQAVPADQRPALARAMIAQERRQQVLAQVIQRLEPNARVEYNPEFAPAGVAQQR